MRGPEVKAIRWELDLTQNELADALGLDNAKGYARRTISDYENGRRPVPGPVALALAHLLEQHRRNV